MSTLNLMEEVLNFESNYKSFRTRNEKILASRKAKELVLSLNSIYKKTKDKTLMDTMKRITEIKRKIEKRLRGRM
ncbi:MULTISPECIES: hypothetical protein [Tenacibaculum]|uniref:hypothetical protein n=1 Tax=Tenacibaculum TaxID=104267 RepID=UPI00089B6E62|nr:MULTISPECIES: hypothetical protein [unclassified Tenacibaculum]RBW56443.1 hypothetical protein DS884_13300 [Tenacibaculum sp. E3R01]SEE48889.1 hypothetical protein SAMN04487765_2790 [Tenacibaculum sp. MAR_2010_89]